MSTMAKPVRAALSFPLAVVTVVDVVVSAKAARRSRAAELSLSATTEAPVSTMKPMRWPSTPTFCLRKVTPAVACNADAADAGLGIILKRGERCRLRRRGGPRGCGSGHLVGPLRHIGAGTDQKRGKNYQITHGAYSLTNNDA